MIYKKILIHLLYVWYSPSIRHAGISALTKQYYYYVRCMAVTWRINDFFIFGVTYLNNPLVATQCPVPASVQRGVVFVHHSRELQHCKYDIAVIPHSIVNIRSVKRHDRELFAK